MGPAGVRGCARAGAALLAACACLAGCNRESRDAVITSPVETGPRGVTLSDLYAGQPAPTPDDPRAQEYEGNAAHIANGQRYYRWFNCNGCHFNGGGGIGPPLMDDKWIYGGRIEQIYATIVQGRPNGMPSFKDKIPESQVWEIAAYVRSLSGEADKLAAPSRREGMRSTPPLNNADPPPDPKGDARNTQGGGG